MIHRDVVAQFIGQDKVSLINQATTENGWAGQQNRKFCDTSQHRYITNSGLSTDFSETRDTNRPQTREIEQTKIELIPIVKVKPGDYVLSLNEETGKIEPRRINGLLDMGIKPVFKLTTATGKSIRTTGNHPYLTKEGWRKVIELHAGIEIAVPNQSVLYAIHGDVFYANHELGKVRQLAEKPHLPLRGAETSAPVDQTSSLKILLSSQQVYTRETQKSSNAEAENDLFNLNGSNKFWQEFTDYPHNINNFAQINNYLSNCLLLTSAQLHNFILQYTTDVVKYNFGSFPDIKPIKQKFDKELIKLQLVIKNSCDKNGKASFLVKSAGVEQERGLILGTRRGQ